MRHALVLLLALAGCRQEKAQQIGEGARLYTQMNCVGCHAHGGGGMGPPLSDPAWIYGSDGEAVFRSIAEGRPNGMPSYRARLTDDQLRQLVSYVRALGGLEPKTASPSRDDHMMLAPQPAVKK